MTVCSIALIILALNIHSNYSFCLSSYRYTKRGLSNSFVRSTKTCEKSVVYSSGRDSTMSYETSVTDYPYGASRDSNPMKVRLIEEVEREDLRSTQLESLLDAFQSAVEEKEQVIKLESDILNEIKEIRAKVTDPFILIELNSAVEEKSALIEIEKGICMEISAVSSSLATQIRETQQKMVELQKVINVLPDAIEKSGGTTEAYLMLLKSSIESSRSRDETVLDLINIFDEATSRKGLELTDFKQATAFVEVAKVVEKEEVKSTFTSIARQTSNEMRIELGLKSNEELAETAGKAAGKTALALVSVTASIFSVGASYVVSTEARQTVEAIMSASKAVTDMGINIRDAITAASVAWDSPAKSSNDGISRTLDGFLLVLRSSDVKTALAALKDNAQKSTDDAGRAADLTSRHVAKSLKNSRRWKNALADLGESVTLLLSIFALSGTRFIQEVQAETNRQLPEAK